MRKSCANYWDYLREHGVGAGLRFAGIKLRAAAARSDYGWQLGFALNPFVKTGHSADYGAQAAEVFGELQKLPGLEVEEISISPERYREYIAQADYQGYGPYYQGDNSGNPLHRAEKMLQHFISLELLDIKPDDTYIDVASNTSPMKHIVRRLLGAETFAMDLSYPAGIHGDNIGCDAGDTKLPDGFASKMTLHCSFEHFAHGADIRFVRECRRLLRPGGKVCIVPLYVLKNYCVRQDPTLEQSLAVSDFEGAERVFVRDYLVDYGRFYSPASFKERILDNCDGLAAKLFRISNLAEFGEENLYSHFALLLEKPAA